jgi:uncharacterized protein YkwD
VKSKLIIGSLFIFWVISPSVLYSQTDWVAKAKAKWSKAEVEQANTGATRNRLSEEEKALYLLTNLARMNGKKFYKEWAAPFMKERNTPATSYTQTLKTDLEKTKGLAPLKVNMDLVSAATYHAKDMGKTGQTGHDSSDGTSTFKRIRKYHDGGAMAENCSYGYSGAMDILMQLLIDEGVSSLGHRNTILNGIYTQMGVAIQPHEVYGYNCVTDFSD